jgi:zinc protease
MTLRRLSLVSAFWLALAMTGHASAQTSATTSGGGIELVALPSPTSPLVSIRAMFTVGSIHDPTGKEGLAALTGLMIGQGGTAKRSFGDLLDALYPLAAGIDVNTDREVTVFVGRVHKETLDAYSRLLQEALLSPGFRQEDFERNREQLLAHLTTTLRSASDELLGLEAIQEAIFEGHPYQHDPAGTVAGLRNITLDDVKAFYAAHYTQANLMLGVAGGYPDGYAAGLQNALAALPPGTKGLMPLPPLPAPQGRNFTIIDKQTPAVGMHFGHPLAITRSDPDFYPLMVANSFLGEHRTFHGRLMQQLRGLRGFNYGDYSYIEYWDNPPGTTNPPPNTPRRQQYFSVWIRPVVPPNAPFALRNAVFEVQRLIEKGLTQQEFDLTRDFLTSYSKLWARSASDRLGFQMDSRFYGTPYFIDEIDRRLKTLTVADVNRAVKKYLQVDSFDAVVVTSEAQALAATIKADQPATVKYDNPVPPEVTTADKEIQSIKIQPAEVKVVPVGEMFEK